MSELIPTALQLTPANELQITWSSGQVKVYPLRELREHCPCAHCNAARDNPKPPALLPLLQAKETQPLRLTDLHPIGNYAYGLTFSDGHNTGIYTLELLQTLGRVV